MELKKNEFYLMDNMTVCLEASTNDGEFIQLENGRFVDGFNHDTKQTLQTIRFDEITEAQIEELWILETMYQEDGKMLPMYATDYHNLHTSLKHDNVPLDFECTYLEN